MLFSLFLVAQTPVIDPYPCTYSVDEQGKKGKKETPAINEEFAEEEARDVDHVEIDLHEVSSGDEVAAKDVAFKIAVKYSPGWYSVQFWQKNEWNEWSEFGASVDGSSRSLNKIGTKITIQAKYICVFSYYNAKIEYNQDRLNEMLRDIETEQRSLLDLQSERDETIAERDEAIPQRDEAIAERDKAIAERDKAIAERDKAIAITERERETEGLAVERNIRQAKARRTHGVGLAFDGLAGTLFTVAVPLGMICGKQWLYGKEGYYGGNEGCRGGVQTAINLAYPAAVALIAGMAIHIVGWRLSKDSSHVKVEAGEMGLLLRF